MECLGNVAACARVLRLLKKYIMRIAEQLQTYHSWDRANVVGLAMLVQLELS